MSCPVSRANIACMNGERLWLTGWPKTPYRSAVGFIAPIVTASARYCLHRERRHDERRYGDRRHRGRRRGTTVAAAAIPAWAPGSATAGLASTVPIRSIRDARAVDTTTARFAAP